MTAQALDASDHRMFAYQDAAPSWSDADSELWSQTPAPFTAGKSVTTGVVLGTPVRGDTVSVTTGGVTGTSQLFNVAGPLAKFVIGVPVMTAGESSPVRVYAEDSLGDVIRSYGGSPSWSDSSGQLSGSPAAFINGESTNTVTLANPYRHDQITVTDGSLSGQSVLFNVLGPLAKFVIGVPVMTAGESSPVRVYAEDSVGDVVRGYGGSPSWSDSSGQLSGSPAAFIKGESTNTVTLANPYRHDQITITDGSLSSQSKVFNVSPGCLAAPSAGPIGEIVTPPAGDTFARSSGEFFRGDQLTLSGSASSPCPHAGPFTYAWTLTDPVGSTATLSSSTASTPSFIADIPSGTWSVALVVTDRLGHQSQPATATLSSGSCGAGSISVNLADQTQAKPFDPHELSATASSTDDDPSQCPSRFANVYSYSWSVSTGSGPGPRYSLSAATGNTVTFSAGDSATWTVSVTATGSNSGLTGAASTSISTFCAAPSPVVGNPYVLSGASSPRTGDFNVGDTITLATTADVSACYSNPADAGLTYEWTLSPAGDDTSGDPAPMLSNSVAVTPSFQVSVAGQRLLASVAVIDKWGRTGQSSAEFASSP